MKWSDMEKKVGVIGIVFILVSLNLISVQATTCSYACSWTNTPPERPSVYITPATPTDNDDLYCNAYSTDTENDEITYHYSWYKNGSLFRTYTTKSNSTYISRAYTSINDTWKCVVKAFDGKAYSEENYDKVTVISESQCENFELSVSATQISLSPNESASINFWIKNLGNYTECIDLEAKDYSAYISASPSKSSVCLNPNESKLLALTVRTTDAPAGSYTVKLRAEGDCMVREEEITVNVSQACCPRGIEVEPIKSNICKGEKGTVSVLLCNRSDRIANVKLEASSNSFVARFKQNEFELDAHQELYAELEVHAEGSLGDHYVYVYARSGSQYVKEKAWFKIVECPEVPARTFEISVPASCIELEKNKDKNIAFTIKNLRNEKQTVNLQTVSDILSDVQKSITLEATQRKTLYVKARAREHDEPGKHYIRIYGWNDNYREKKELCIEVKPMHKSIVSLTENDLEIAQCSFAVFVLTIENQGDLDENYEITINNSTQASIKASDTKFSLEPKSGKEIFITVTVPEDMPLGDYNAEVIIENEDIWVKSLRFKVVESAAPVIEKRPMLVSYPVSIAIFPGEQRKASIVVLNPSTESIDVTIEFELPEGFHSQNRSFTLKAGKAKEIVNTIEAEEWLMPGESHYGKIIMSYDGERVEKKIRLYVEGLPPEEPEPSTGMVTLSAPLAAGVLLFLAFILIILMIRNITNKEREFKLMLKRR